MSQPPGHPASPLLLSADRRARRAAIALGAALPGDVLLYLLLPMFADRFGVTLAEVGVPLAANRLVRIVGYGWVARFYARHGDRPTCELAVVAACRPHPGDGPRRDGPCGDQRHSIGPRRESTCRDLSPRHFDQLLTDEVTA